VANPTSATSRWRRLTSVRAVDAEHGAEDDVERDALHLGLDGEGPAEGPAIDGALGQVAHRLGIGLHALAVERRQHEPALAQVAGTVQQQERVHAEDGLELHVRLTRAQRARVAGEDVADRIRMAEEHERRLAGDAEGEGVAVAPPAFVEECRRSEPAAQELEQRRHARSGRQRRPLGMCCGESGREREGSVGVHRRLTHAARAGE
jgi:hypothetical protein